MAYQLGRHEHLVKGIRRVVIEQLKAARKNLSGPQSPNEKTIHAARKKVKKIRAILAAIDAAGGRGIARSKQRLHDVNHVLSPLRDLDAMVRTLEKLRDIHPHLFSEHAFGRIRRNLLSQKQRALEATRARGLWRSINEDLRQLPSEVLTWRVPGRGFGVLANGIRAAQREGRRSLRRARVSQCKTDFHAWRKQVKKLWYLMRLLEGSGDRMHRDIKALGRAEESLGDAHDMSALCTELSMDADLFSTDVARLQFRRAITDLQASLYIRAIASTQRIYRQKARRYAGKVKSVWRRGRTQREPLAAQRAAQSGRQAQVVSKQLSNA